MGVLSILNEVRGNTYSMCTCMYTRVVIIIHNYNKFSQVTDVGSINIMLLYGMVHYNLIHYGM